MIRDFFISYTKVDERWAEWIAWVLEEAGYTVFIQAWDILPGVNFIAEMQKAMTKTRKTIAVLSEDYFKSGYTEAEWTDAIRRDREGGERILIPIKVRECNAAGFFGITVFVDVVGLSDQDARANILGAFSARRKPPSAPSFPGEAQEARVVEGPTEFPGAAASGLGSVTGRIIDTAEAADIMTAPLRQHPASASKSALTAHERLRLYNTLMELSPSRLNLLVFALAPPAQAVPSMPAPPKDRVEALLRWAEGSAGSLAEVQDTLDAMLKQPARQRPAPEEADRGRGIVNTCDRKKQDEDFETLFDLCNKGRCGHAQVYIIHGPEREGHKSLVERFRNTQLRVVAGGATPPLWELEWPQLGKLRVDSQRLVSLLFEERKCGDVSGRPRERARHFRECVASLPGPVVITHEIDAGEWLRTTRRLIRSYIKFWDEVKRADDEAKKAGAEGALPLFVVFLTVVYPAFEGRPGGVVRRAQELWHWSKIKRARASLWMLSKMWGRSPTASPAPQRASVALLEELPCVKLSDVKKWMIRHKYGTYEVESEAYSQELFVGNGWQLFECKNMADVELALSKFVAASAAEGAY